jgi:myo-inositol-1(or 4)-monophosphatase
MDLEKIKEVGVTAARRGAEVLCSYFGTALTVKKKSAVELVTQADVEAEKTIIKTIRETYPDHSIIAEESGHSKKETDYQWIIDPLDGTTNFAHHLPLYCISIGFAVKKRVCVGVVLNPEGDELFVAIADQGATLNGRSIQVSDTDDIAESLLVTGFPYDFKKNIPAIQQRFVNCLEASLGIRRLGSAALDLCYVACGRFEGFWEQNLKPWDTAAGFCIAQEAGARVTDFSDRAFTTDKNEILATNCQIHKQMLALLQLRD